jgi:hypothetical protein
VPPAIATDRRDVEVYELCDQLVVHSTVCSEAAQIKDKMKVKIHSCGRCGREHELESKKLHQPMDDYTYWATCPTFGEPIMIAITGYVEDHVKAFGNDPPITPANM